MYARSTTIMARTDLIDPGVTLLRDEVMPELMRLDGCLGMSVMCDRSSGRCIATSAWENQAAMRATMERLQPSRENAAAAMGATSPPTVEEWEIGILHRVHPTSLGACARAVWVQVPPMQIDRSLDLYRMVTLPAMESFDDFCSASLLIDRTTGRSCSTATYQDAAALDANREQAAMRRDQMMKDMGGTVLDVAEFEVALAHLHVPETV
jgi:quinol monooxygenase YgiN